MANATGFRATKTFNCLAESDYCEHCSAEDLSKAVGYFYENDSHGPVGRYIVCAECRQEGEEAEGNQPTCCHDCKLTVLVKDTIAWKWYDFYAAQGDEPVIICKACAVLPTHIKRVERDNADYVAEFGHQEDEAYYGDPADEHDEDDIDPSMFDEEE